MTCQSMGWRSIHVEKILKEIIKWNQEGIFKKVLKNKLDVKAGGGFAEKYNPSQTRLKNYSTEEGRVINIELLKDSGGLRTKTRKLLKHLLKYSFPVVGHTSDAIQLTVENLST